MTRATRVALWSITLVIAYILAFFQFIQVPFFTKEHAEQILPVVSPVILSPPVPDAHKSCLVTMVVTHFLRFILTLVTRTWPLHVSRVHRRVWGIVERESRTSVYLDILRSGTEPSIRKYLKQSQSCDLEESP